LTGPYSGLPEASGRVWAMVSEKKIELRDDYAIENYLNDPKTTPEEQLITEILVPAA
jgi:effector-binding domain-containing protein